MKVELQPDVRSSNGCFFQFLKLFPALLLDLHRSLCLEHSSSAPLSGLKRSVTFFQNRSLFFFTSTPHSLCIAIKFVYMAFVCLPYETLSFLKKMSTSFSSFCCWKAGPFQGLRVGSHLTLGKKLCKEIHVIKARVFIGKGCSMKSHRVREPGRTALPVARSLRFSGDGISFRVVSAQSFSFQVFLVVYTSLS